MCQSTLRRLEVHTLAWKKTIIMYHYNNLLFIRACIRASDATEGQQKRVDFEALDAGSLVTEHQK